MCNSSSIGSLVAAEPRICVYGGGLSAILSERFYLGMYIIMRLVQIHPSCPWLRRCHMSGLGARGCIHTPGEFNSEVLCQSYYNFSSFKTKSDGGTTSDLFQLSVRKFSADEVCHDGKTD